MIQGRLDLNLNGEPTPTPTTPAPMAPSGKAHTALSIDIETYSSADLSAGGVYPYTEAADFEILLFAYAFDDEAVRVVDMANGEELPDEVVSALTDPRVTKRAYNAPFERRCISRALSVELPVHQWEDTMVKAAASGYPFGLDAVARAMGFPEDRRKMAAGKALVRFFCLPCKPSRANNGRTRNLPRHDPDKWETFKAYCAQDVEVERAIGQDKRIHPLIHEEAELWELDQSINDRGVLVDMELVNAAMAVDNALQEANTAKAAELTALDNPNSVSQLKEWLSDKTGEDISSLSKSRVEELQAQSRDPEVKALLHLRREMSKTSLKKYAAMAAAVCPDNRIRGLMQFYGANRTGRWSGRLVQVQNLPQNHLRDLDVARTAVMSGDADTVSMLYGSAADTLSQLIRTAFIAPEGSRFIVADYSAIEARVIAYLADEQWRLDVFKSHGKIYEASAAQMFKMPINEIHKGSPERQKGKVAELALGYGGGVNALIAMGALNMGLYEVELPDIVNAWRAASPRITALWDTVNVAAQRAVNGESVTINHNIQFIRRNGALLIVLPSGRPLAYCNARIGKNRFGGYSVLYDGSSQTTKQWGQQETYGGKLAENIVQAFARDCLAVAMQRLNAAGYPIVFHVHDEVIAEVPYDSGLTLARMCDIMGEEIHWAQGLPLRADGCETNYYKKD